ncbi:S-layer homology domain-containing protein, partial [Sporosarcina sp. P29]|uniref:S-layer homology domain-containing protein n=2 Tax=unclassified Sporosarcina TaxID=2647733 RepID=UPI000C4A0278
MKKTSKASHKLFRAALATTVATGAFVAAVPAETNAAISFKDVTNPAVHYYKPVLELAERGVVKGYDDGTYRPNASVTRAQSAKILAHVLDLDTVNVKDPGFKDVKKGTPYYGP